MGTHCQENHIFCSTEKIHMSSQNLERFYLKSYWAWAPSALPLPCESHGGTSIATTKPSKVPLGDCGVGFSLSVCTGQWQHLHEAGRNTCAGVSTNIPSQSPWHVARWPSTARAASSPPGASCSCVNSVKLLATASALHHSQCSLWESLT